jgi:hypothetical protein
VKGERVRATSLDFALNFGCCCFTRFGFGFGEQGKGFTVRQLTQCLQKEKWGLQNPKLSQCSVSLLQVTLKPAERSSLEPVSLSSRPSQLLASPAILPAKMLLPICQGGGFRSHISATERRTGNQPYTGS